ncbi:hypothetical protein AMAG_15198 [Allomyces macrogynus ATCC 38327]|uniref:Uncharacterized protein n=1 Tax=Allomyces macrogynus (strain ATCC 38327) TaxID=578462 RepID=A0A0L0T652_ALLM3|nr:hypothetical protein AMAG_15198 [Allomyces macrogynus ATCC 38327]|eukprot:KNE70230.1 hypothetical protein AMAG_15198 [Allomyces macrogynus ATCC 38327]
MISRQLAAVGARRLTATAARRAAAAALAPAVVHQAWFTATASRLTTASSLVVPRRTYATELNDGGAANAAAQAAQLLASASAALEAGLVEQALAGYLQSDRALPTPEARFNAGNVCLQLGRIDDAITHWHASLELAELPDTLLNLANVQFLMKRDTDGAVALYERALQAHLRAAAEIEDSQAAAAAVAEAGEIWFNLGCVCDAAANMAIQGGQAPNDPNATVEQIADAMTPDPQRAVDMWAKAELAFGEAAKAKIDRADMFQRNVAAKRMRVQAEHGSAEDQAAAGVQSAAPAKE